MHIGLIGGAIADQVYDPIAEGARARGHRVSRYLDVPAVLADPAAPGMEIAFSIHCRFDEGLMAALPRLRAILSPVTGIDGIDERAARRRGLAIGTGQTPENYISMAEATILLILATLYDLPGRESLLRDAAPRLPPRGAHMLWRKTIGMIGFGKIAQAVAERLASWDVHIQATPARMRSDLPFGAVCVTLDELLSTSDVIVVAAALNDQTSRLLNAERLALIPPHAVLINIARGAILDEAALVGMAREKRIAAIALDAFTVEPLPLDSPLRALPNAILTPHMIGHTEELTISLVRNALDSIDRIAGGLPPNNLRVGDS